ncbi:unnamed protein product [Closterium sp. Naga37s-1]|nr:unnamed protein product [Closterium sp. Naga37s-1]
MNTWSWQDSLRQAATIRTLPHAWKDHFLPQQQQLDAQPPQPSEASFDKLLNTCNSSPAFSSRLALLNGAACASLPALEPLPRGAELVSVRASYDQLSPALSFSLSAAHCQPPVPSPASDTEPAAEFMRTDETQQGQRCEWEGEWRETDELMSPRSSTGSCCDPDDLDSLLEAPRAFGQLAVIPSSRSLTFPSLRHASLSPRRHGAVRAAFASEAGVAAGRRCTMIPQQQRHLSSSPLQPISAAATHQYAQ